MDPNLLVICLNAFAAVLGLLWVLAIALRGLIEVFPEPAPPKAGQIDTAVTVAIATAANAILPGARVTRIEEIR